ncbi:MAG TPA: hypothetical protein IAA29_15975 [Candidatus Paenibacillus intestinavium]|nr:hypothetical protein [Candidatus Paenibacillus intestinavium]
MNQPTFFTFRKPSDWGSGTSFQLQGELAGLQITRDFMYRQVKRTTIPFINGHETIIDTVLTDEERWYMLDSKGCIWRTDLISPLVELVMSLPYEESYQPARIAVSRESIIVLYDGEQGSMLQSYLLDRAQLKWSTTAWYSDNFTGYELINDDQDGVIIIGLLSSSGDIQLLRFDAVGEPMLNVELPQRKVLAEEQLQFSTDQDKYQLLLDDQHNVLIFDGNEQRLLRWQLSNNMLSMIMVALPFQSVRSICYHANHQYWALVSPTDEDQGCELISFSLDGDIYKRGQLELAHGEQVEAGQHNIYVWNDKKQEIYTVHPISETAYWQERHGHIGVWCSQSLDSGVAGTQWHRVKLQVHKQQDTQWNVSYYAADQKEIAIGHEIINLDEFIRNDSIPVLEKLDALAPYWISPLKDAEDALLHHANGRYLWIFIELIGSSMHSPIIESMEVYFPRSSYLTYLPSIYQRDATSQDFLSRYLSIYQSLIEDTDQQIASVTRSLEPNQVSGRSLKWLLGWLGIESDDYWSEDQLRELMKEAPKLYSMRGTKYAIETLVRIYTGFTPIVLEYEQVKPLKENVELGDVADRLYAADPHAFNVLVKVEHVDTELKRVTLQHIVESYKPVFATFKLVILQPWVYMDLHSYLGMNTVLSEPMLLTLDGRSSMPHHTITIDVGQDNRMDKHTRIGLNSRLE